MPRSTSPGRNKAQHNPQRSRLVISDRRVRVYHLKNAAARVQALALVPQYLLDRPGARAKLVQDKRLPGKLFNTVEIKVGSFFRQPWKASTKRPLPRQNFVIGRKRTPQELASFVTDMAQINPKGFRQPSNKRKKQHSTSLVEKLWKLAA